MIELLAVLAVILIFVSMTAVSSVRTKKLSSESTARVYAGTIQNYISDFNKKKAMGNPNCTELIWQAIATNPDLVTSLILLGGAVESGGQKMFQRNAADGTLPAATALVGYDVIFPSTSNGVLLVKSGGALLYP